MTKQRQRRGDGGIRLRADGRWEWSIRLPGGKRNTGYANPNTETAARAQLRRAQATVEAGRPLLDQRTRLATFLDQWLKEVIQPKRSYDTWRGYRSNIESHIRGSANRDTSR